MHKLDEAETRMILLQALFKVPNSAFADMASGNDERRRKGRESAIRHIMAHFKLAGHWIERGKGAPDHGWPSRPVE